MLLALDIGNTNLKYGVFRERSLLHRLRTATRRQATAGEIAAQLREWLAGQGLAASEVSGSIVASVVPSLTWAVLEALRQAFGTQPLLVGPDLPTGITLLGPSALEVGADRIVNAVAAWSLAREPASGAQPAGPLGSVIVDLGTATKLDCVSPRGELLGGVIAPGVSVSLNALVSQAEQLRAVALRAPPRVLGRTTIECVQSGLVHGHASLVDGLVARLRRELPFECQVIATGGAAPLVAPHTETLSRIEPDLTLQGLRAIYELNAG